MSHIGIGTYIAEVFADTYGSIRWEKRAFYYQRYIYIERIFVGIPLAKNLNLIYP